MKREKFFEMFVVTAAWWFTIRVFIETCWRIVQAISTGLDRKRRWGDDHKRVSVSHWRSLSFTHNRISCAENCNENWTKKIWKSVADKFNGKRNHQRQYYRKFYPKYCDHDGQCLLRRPFPYWLVFVPTITNRILFRRESAEGDCICRFPLLSKDTFKMCKFFQFFFSPLCYIRLGYTLFQ